MCYHHAKPPPREGWLSTRRGRVCDEWIDLRRSDFKGDQTINNNATYLLHSIWPRRNTFAIMRMVQSTNCSCAAIITRHRASTSMHSLTFRVRVTTPPQYGRNGTAHAAGASILSLARGVFAGMRSACSVRWAWRITAELCYTLLVLPQQRNLCIDCKSVQ